MRGSRRPRQCSESQTKQKSVSRLGIEPRSSDLPSDALPIKLSRPTPWPHHSTSSSSHCGQRRHCHLSRCSDTNSAWLPAPNTRETLFLPRGELSSGLEYSSRYQTDEKYNLDKQIMRGGLIKELAGTALFCGLLRAFGKCTNGVALSKGWPNLASVRLTL